MSRTTSSASRPRREGTYRPQLEALEDRSVPGSLLDTSPGFLIDLDSDAIVRDLEADDLAPFAANAARSQGLTHTPVDDSLVLEEAMPLPDKAARDDGETTDPAALGGGLTTSSGATQTTQPVVDFPTRTIVFGESTLTRTDHGITLHLTAIGVPAGAYTGWIPIFNPGGTVPIVAGRVAGHVVGEGGKLTFSVHLKEGEIISGHPVFPSGSLQDARGQDIGMVVRYHGPAEPGRIHEQTHTFELGVAVDYLFTRHNAS